MTHKNMFTPTPELMQEWLTKWKDKRGTVPYDEFFATQAAQWGADQELEACCEWLETGPYGFSIEATAPSMTKRLRAARRPKPLSLKKEALAQVESFACSMETLGIDSDLIRRALESLPD